MQNTKSEKSPLISGQPAPVTPYPTWESNLPPRDSNGKGSIAGPKDKYRIVFLIFTLLGLGTLMPWIMFITAESYFEDFKFGANNTEPTENNYLTNSMQNMDFASQLAQVLFIWLNIFVNFGGNQTCRIVYSIVIQMVILLVRIVLAMLDSSEWPGPFFWITMVCIVLLNISNGIYQNTIYEVVASLPTKYTDAVVLGSNICGVFTTVMSILWAMIFDSKRNAAISYFLTAILVLLLCFNSYFTLPLNMFFRHYATISRNSEKETASKQQLNVPHWAIFKKASPQLFNIFFTFFVSRSVFPAIQCSVCRSDPEFIVSNNYYELITSSLIFNVCAMLGRLTTSWVQWPGPKFLWVPVVLRLVFIFLVVFCNKNIDNDWIYCGVGILMAYSSGYLGSLGKMYARQTVDTKYQKTVVMYAAAMLKTGIFFGVMFRIWGPGLWYS